MASNSGDHSSSDKYQLWGGRFEVGNDAIMKSFNDSLPFDKRLWREDIAVSAIWLFESHLGWLGQLFSYFQGSKGWAKAIEKVGLLTKGELELILSGLDKVGTEWDSDSFVIKENDEDIHTANERRLKVS